ncbi:hypothetical protein RFI_05025 [Reticulomyxa filosa]|uniref:PH domain-containing protein n=1 Tax=Reticulomyxa filosa TaxID=46433 RepID=X6P1F5_RETFI|nr:hypothetical protein RFI_05025 [Reticulomyxa filosa]|eukprot:ETO32091.1 hypothetical protein RFI_05025 [Reticulomyxa filosa]
MLLKSYLKAEKQNEKTNDKQAFLYFLFDKIVTKKLSRLWKWQTLRIVTVETWDFETSPNTLVNDNKKKNYNHRQKNQKCDIHRKLHANKPNKTKQNKTKKDYELDSVSEKDRDRLFDSKNDASAVKAPEPVELWDSKTFTSKANELEKMLKQVSNRIDKEHQNTIMQGALERKTSQQVFGKKLWEQRYFRLSTHYLSAYRNENDTEPEQRWRLASVCWIYLCVEKASGTRFNVYFDNDTLQLRGQNLALCQHWVTKFGDAKKRHRNALRENLQQLGLFEKAMDAYHAQSKMKRTVEKTQQEEVKKAEKTKDNKPKDKDKDKAKKDIPHEKRLQLRTWGTNSDDFVAENSLSTSITFADHLPLFCCFTYYSFVYAFFFFFLNVLTLPEAGDKTDDVKSPDKSKIVIRPHLTRMVSFSGFLVFARQSVEKNAAVAGKKKEYFFTLEGDVLEYKNTPNDTVNIGMLSLDRIQLVYRDSTNSNNINNANEWHVSFVNNTIMKWLFESPFNSDQSSKKWIGVMKRGSKEARAVKWTVINEYKWTGGILKTLNSSTIDAESTELKLTESKHQCVKKLMNCFMPEDWDKKTSSKNANEDSVNDDDVDLNIKNNQQKNSCCSCTVL